MKNIFLFILVFQILFSAQEMFAQSKKTIAILNLTSEGVSISEANIITDRLRTELFRTNYFNVLEREKMDDILSEQGFQLSGCMSDECVVEAGKLIGVQQMVAGYIGKIGNLITLNVRIIDVESGQIINTATEDCSCSIDRVLTQSVKNIAFVLSNREIENSKKTSRPVKNYSYSKSNKKTNNKPRIQPNFRSSSDTSGISEFLALGFSQTDFSVYKQNKFSLENWKNYNSSKLSPWPSIFKSLLIPGWAQLSLGRGTGYFYLVAEISIISYSIYERNNMSKLDGQSIKYLNSESRYEIALGALILNHLLSGVLAKNIVTEINNKRMKDYLSLYFYNSIQNEFGLQLTYNF